MKFFISYSSKDSKEAFKICDLLEKKGLKCFIAPRDIRPGREYGEEIVNGIDNAEAVILLLSQEANNSPHVLREVERAVSKNVAIYVCSLEKVELSKSMEYFLMAHQWGNMEATNDYSNLVEWAVGFSKEPKDTNIVQSAPKEKRKKSIGMKLVGVVGALFMVLLLCIGLFRLGEKDRVAEVSLGDTIALGTYNGEPVEWRVLRIEGEQAVLVSKDILTMKAYDAAESGKYNYIGTTDYWKEELSDELELQIQVRGNSAWNVSNIRTWLNSDKEVVIYSDQKPQKTAMSEYKNGYDNEPGFLNGFTQEELAAIVETEVITNTNGLYDANKVTTMDKVYLLSLDELAWFEEAGISVLAVPTQAAIEQDESGWYAVEKNAYGVEEYYWWLREPVAEVASKCYLVGNGYWEEETIQSNVGGEGFGIRPAITVDLKADYLCEMYTADN